MFLVQVCFHLLLQFFPAGHRSHYTKEFTWDMNKRNMNKAFTTTVDEVTHCDELYKNTYQKADSWREF